ncbi:AAA family ATPase, partial [Actinoplanes philippinensis]|uniref:AAA family ATPase n=1 Tax=Actinoplanes philippinensis TaxID=35752 RepID=UPI0033D0D415
LGMGQRLGIAAALLADPPVLILDEPVNGLDPDGIRWIRDLMRGLAAEGRTVFVSSHLMSEMALTAGHLIVVGHGRLLADEPLADFIARAELDTVLVRSSEPDRLHRMLAGPEVTVTTVDRGVFEVAGLDAQQIGDRAAAAGVTLHELSTRRASLEDAFMRLTHDAHDHRENA